MDRNSLSCVAVNKPLAAVNRVLICIHVVLATAAIAHRLLHGAATSSIMVTAMLVAADATLLFVWALSQAAMWRPVTRTAFPDRLRKSTEEELPGLDVLVVTADPDKEPTVEVINTVLSAMALDYPNITVYLSDDAGSPLTLLAARRAYAFATTAWLPFCRKYNLTCPCPSIYFSSFSASSSSSSSSGDHDHGLPPDQDERLTIKKMYESLTADLLEEEKEVRKKKQSRKSAGTNDKADHDAYVEIITDDDNKDDAMPMLVYVSREKRRTSPHHFKAGALNVLLRVSSLMSNSPYVLVLDCDMKCNSRSSAMEAMCFHLDPPPDKDQQHLAFVQFPQMFRNLSPNDIYANELRPIFATRWKGLDGLRGPILSGTGFYARRDALYGATPSATQDDEDAGGELERRFGRSKDLVASVRTLLSTTNQQQQRQWSPSLSLQQEAKLVASCAYEEEEGTGWGHQVGFLYQSVVEDYFTGYRQLFCRGWTSVYCYPTTAPAAFLGSVPTNLNDVLVQNKRWMSGMLAVGVSRRYCPLLSRESLSVSVLQSMAFAYYALVSLSAFPLLCYATLVPLSFFQQGLLFGPSTSFFAFAAFVSSNLQHLIEVSVAKNRLALRTWWNEQRFWMLNAVTAQLFACITVFLDLVGAGTIDFELTNKASDDAKLYQNGVFDFTGCSTLLLPATTLTVLNLAALLGGTCKMIITGRSSTSSGELLPQFFLMCYVAALSYPLLEGMFIRHDSARVPRRITALSVAIAAALLAMFAS